MFATSDTIVAIATPPGRGGLGVVRLSGPDAAAIALQVVGRIKPLAPRTATFARLQMSSSGSIGDEVVLLHFPAPRSYTGQDIVEISAHGSPVVLAALLRASIERGARLAEPGEFTLRAFLNGKRDLIQAEAVADIIDAVTPLQARAAFDQLEGTLTGAIAAIETDLFEVMSRLEASLDFPDEGYHFVDPGEAQGAVGRIVQRVDALLADAARGRLVRDGAQVVMLGAPNVGKSSLFNALLNTNRAIVTALPGTTRDLLTERADIGGLALLLVDSAGVRDTGDEVEREGVARARGAMVVADLVVVVLDRSRPLGPDDMTVLTQTADLRRLVVVNKVDLPPAWDAVAVLESLPASAGVVGDFVPLSVRTGEGLDALVVRLGTALAGDAPTRDTPLVTNVRHVALLEQARTALLRADASLTESFGQLPEEFLLADLHDAAVCLQEMTGRRTSEDVLRHIFATFCIGK